MECNRAGEMMSLAMDKMLSNDEMQELQDHMDKCDLCREDFELFQSIQSTLKLEEAASLPENFHNDLMHRIENELIKEEDSSDARGKDTVVPLIKPAYKRFNFRRFNVAAAVVLVLIIGVLGIDSLDRSKTLNESESLTMTTSKEAMSDTAESAMNAKSGARMVEDASKESLEISETGEASVEEAPLDEAPAPMMLKTTEVDESDEATEADQMTEDTYGEDSIEMIEENAEVMMAKDTESQEMTIKTHEEPEQIDNEVTEDEVSLPIVIISIVVGVGALLGIAIVILRKLR